MNKVKRDLKDNPEDKLMDKIRVKLKGRLTDKHFAVLDTETT